jgi:tetratricopeptide (TPR) repeat protein
LQPLLAELISLNAESPTDPAVQAKIARLFLSAGSPDRSASAWQTYLNSHGNNENDESAATAWAGLGEAELQASDYPKARKTFREAQMLNPNDAAVKSRYELVDLVTALDPTPHQLSAAAKLDAEEVLAAAEQTWQLRVKTCAGIPNEKDALRLLMRKLAAQ